MLRLMSAKVTAVLAVKVLPTVKLLVGAGSIIAVIVGAATQTLPLQDIWFDYVLFIIASAVVGGMPEPDTQLNLPRFMYMWAYRTGHLLVASATAYFIHQQKWPTIRDGVGETATPPVVKTN